MAEQTYVHIWDKYGPGDHPRWKRYKCQKCGSFAQFHTSSSPGEQNDYFRKTCPLNTVPPTPASVAQHKKSLEARNAD